MAAAAWRGRIGRSAGAGAAVRRKTDVHATGAVASPWAGAGARHVRTGASALPSHRSSASSAALSSGWRRSTSSGGGGGWVSKPSMAGSPIAERAHDTATALTAVVSGDLTATLQVIVTAAVSPHDRLSAGQQLVTAWAARCLAAEHWPAARVLGRPGGHRRRHGVVVRLPDAAVKRSDEGSSSLLAWENGRFSKASRCDTAFRSSLRLSTTPATACRWLDLQRRRPTPLHLAGRCTAVPPVGSPAAAADRPLPPGTWQVHGWQGALGPDRPVCPIRQCATVAGCTCPIYTKVPKADLGLSVTPLDLRIRFFRARARPFPWLSDAC